MAKNGNNYYGNVSDAFSYDLYGNFWSSLWNMFWSSLWDVPFVGIIVPGKGFPRKEISRTCSRERVSAEKGSRKKNDQRKYD